MEAFRRSADELLKLGQALPPTATPQQRFQQMRDEVFLMKDALRQGVSLFERQDEDAARRVDALLKSAQEQLASPAAGPTEQTQSRRLESCCAESRSLLQAAYEAVESYDREPSYVVEVMSLEAAPDVAPGNLLDLQRAFFSLHQKTCGAVRAHCETALRETEAAMEDPECLDRFQRKYADLQAQAQVQNRGFS
ncbi:hypothetical protein [Roseateles sp. L2-2]|uniref:hypothetical protein n=1 Tax=Roseateles sp. L2-2 TaxID=3422597 RepID=UPI003D365D5D